MSVKKAEMGKLIILPWGSAVVTKAASLSARAFVLRHASYVVSARKPLLWKGLTCLTSQKYISFSARLPGCPGKLCKTHGDPKPTIRYVLPSPHAVTRSIQTMMIFAIMARDEGHLHLSPTSNVSTMGSNDAEP